MNDVISVVGGSGQEIRDAAQSVIAYLPNVAIAAAVLLLGWLIARLMRFVVMRGVRGLDRVWQPLSDRFNLPEVNDQLSPSTFIAELLFWVVIFVFFLAATDVLGLEVFRLSMTAILAYLPVLAGAALLIFVGSVTGMLARDAVIASCEAASVEHGVLLGRCTQAVILLVTVIISFDQLGLDIAFLSVVIGIFLASVLGSIGLAFGLGARQQVSNLLAAKQLRDRLGIGDLVRIDDIEGRVTEIGTSHITIENEKATIHVPASLYDNRVFLVGKIGASSAG